MHNMAPTVAPPPPAFPRNFAWSALDYRSEVARARGAAHRKGAVWNAELLRREYRPAVALLSLILFVFATAGTPGPNNTIAMAAGASFGFRRTLPIIAGVNLGFPLLILLVGVGLGQALERWPVILDVLRPLGVLYLLYLAVRIATGPTDIEARRQGKPPGFVHMTLFQAVNPKAWTMAVGAIAAYTGFWESFLLEVLVIAGVFMVFGLPCTTTWALLGVGAGRVMTTARRMRVFNLVMATVLAISLIPAITEVWRSLSG